MSFKTSIRKSKTKPLGFTIVELLIVIVIIGILAAITIVSYIGISKKATEASLTSDLDGAKRQLELYKTEHETYPTTMDENKCPTAPINDTKYCLKNKDFQYTTTDNGLTYTLKLTKSDVTFEVTNDSTPKLVAAAIPVTAIAAITGTLQIGQTLTAGAITPAAATVTYKWQSSTTSNGTYIDIPGAISNTYIIESNNASKYLKVVVTGINNYSGTQTSVASSQIAADPDWITIGTQAWAKKNLNVGNMLANGSYPTNNSIIEKYCYNHLESNCDLYGGYYMWHEAMNWVETDGAQGICPVGSHIPTFNDWKTLEKYLGMTQLQADALNTWTGTDQGAQLKVGGSSGFDVLLAGQYDIESPYYWDLGDYGTLWSSTPDDTYGSIYVGWEITFKSDRDTIAHRNWPEDPAYSVRCIKN